MAINKTIINPSSSVAGGKKTAMELDMKNMSQSELYTLSQCCSSAFDLSSTENIVVIPTINSDHQSTSSIATTTTTNSPTRIYAFSHRRAHRRHISASEHDITDLQLEENRLILNSLDKLVAESDANDSNPQVVAEVSKRKRKRKRKLKDSEENVEDEFQGLGSITVDGEEIDLRFLARDADKAFETKLDKMTEGMVREDEFLGFMAGLEGRWGSNRRRRKYVDAAGFLKVLPANWKILLSLRPRAREPSLYCRRFVSPSDIPFKFCKEVAFYLKSELVTNDANPPNEGAAMPRENDHQATGPEAMAVVPISSVAAAEVNLLDDVLRVQQPNPLPVIYLPYPVAENSVKHKSVVVKEELDPLPDSGTNQNEPRLGDANCLKPSSMPESSNEPQKNSEVTRNVKTRCIWCLGEFSRAPVDAETLASSSGFICPKCKKEISGRLEETLAKMYPDAHK